MTLLRQIQDEATDHTVPVATLLRRALVLARRLSYTPLSEWAQRELDGYADDDDLPDYRAWRPCQVLGDFSGPMGSSIRNQPLPSSVVDGMYRKVLFGFELRHGIAQYQGFVEAGSDDLSFPWDQNVVALYQGDFIEFYGLVRARRVVTLSDLRQLLDAVRTRLLNFALEIEEQAPNAGEAEPGSAPLPESTVAHAFHIHVTGDHNVVATGGRDVQQVTEARQTAWEDARAALAELGIPEQELADLQQAVSADERLALPGGTMGPATTRWYGKITDGLSDGTLQLATGVSAEMIATVLLKLLGVG